MARLFAFRQFGLCLIFSAAPALAATDYPIDGSSSVVSCAGNPQLTGKRFGAYPSTITGCVLAGDWTAGLPQIQRSVVCKGGRAIAFYPGAARIRSCTLAMDQTLMNASGGQTPCKGGGGAEFREDGRLNSCAGGGAPTGAGGGTGGSKPPQPPQPPAQPPSQPNKPQASTASVTVPGESGKLSGGGKYTMIGASSNRPGGRGGYLYLGDGRASAAYTASVQSAGKYSLWIRFDDDGKHAAGARAVEVSVNGATVLRWNNPSQDTKGWVNIPIGAVDLRAGQNSIVFTKAATSSAAFVLDEFVLSNVPGYVPR